MRGFPSSSVFGRLRSPWTCSNCAGTRLLPARTPRFFQSRNYSSSSSRPSGRVPNPKSRRGLVLLAAGGGAATTGVLAFTDDIKYSYEAAERTGRVAAALAICINDYRTTLNQRDSIEDPDEQATLLKACHKRCAVRTLEVLEKNGGIFIKLGQHLSAMNYLLPREWTVTFVPLQDKCPVSSFDSIAQMYRDDTGEVISEYFSEFAEEPIGAASLAQVHLATVKETGQKVAVKVQHPGLAQWAPLDLSLTKFTFATLKRFFPEYDLEWLSSEMAVSVPKELDFQQEAANAKRTQEYFSHIPELPLVVPDVIWAKKRILVMAYESGHRPDDLDYLDSNRIDRDEVSAALARIFNEMIFGNGAPLHCDPHGGNIAIRKNASRRLGPNFDVILYDHGLYRDIPLSLRRSYAKMWLAVIDGDLPRMRTYAKEVAGIGDDEFPIFASAITGRDFSVLQGRAGGPSLTGSRRDSTEKTTVSTALQEGLLAHLVQMLGRVPRIILLILKTNDLTRSLDENLHTRQGPVRTFLILARYCSRTVFEEQVDEIRGRGSLLWPPNGLRLLLAWLGFVRVEVKLGAFEMWLGVKRTLGLGAVDLGM